ncbi:hypothetical protein evm_014645 [Chilo suppressalis]|nr:hypothetical protein evm_014645 [Chilo suppressalis]
MPSCSVIVCKNRSATRDLKRHGITYHKFPREKSIKQKWISSTGRGPDWWPTDNNTICSIHFEEKCFQPYKKTRRLFEWAEPTLKLRLVFATDSTNTTSALKCAPTQATNRSSENKILNESEMREEEDIPNGLQSHSPIPSLRDHFNPGIDDTPRKKQLRIQLERCENILKKKKQTIKRLQKKASRYKKKIVQLTDMLKELQDNKFVSSDQVTHLESLGDGVNELIQRFAKKNSGVGTTGQYPPALRTFACTLHFYSPKAYQYVRKKFQTCLPHPRTIRKWYESIDAQPGFTKESLEAIKLKADNTKYRLICNLVMDEMAIRQRVEWDGKEMHGYVDICKSGTESDSLPIAKEALVFLLTAINGAWKVPVGYFLVDGVSGQQRANLVIQCLELLHETGVDVTSLTFDGCPANLTMAKELGCNLDTDHLKTDFEHPVIKKPVYIFPDPCHMLKLVRNALETNNVFIDNSNREVNWNHLINLNNIQEREKLHLANKLRRNHVFFKNQKMKVRLASQLFSNSVADALDFCSQLSVPGFENVEGTVYCLRTVNNLFDTLNSRNMAQLHFKKPLCPHNKQLIFDFLENADQDHIELLFGHIRAHGGCNTNPTARQFRAIYKKLLVKAELRDVDNGNCQSLEKISLLTCSSSIQNINITTEPRELNVTEDDEYRLLYEMAVFDEEASMLVQDLSDFSIQAITYIAGFVVRALMKTLKCETCIGALTVEDKEHEHYKFTKVKDKGGLVYPSSDVITICKRMEVTIKATVLTENQVTVSTKDLKSVLIAKALPHFIGMNLFNDIHLHQFDQSPLNNHLTLLTKAVMEKYINVRLHYLTKNAAPKLSKRQVLSKYLHFSGQ